jgi:signal transduction histidine kinase
MVSEHNEHVAVVAHGLLNPMAAVLGGIDLALRNDDLPPRVRDALGASHRQALAVTESLRQLAQGLPPEVLAALEDLRRHEPKVAP